ncbi:MAG TPA: hypothetical protein VFF47_06165 [Nitrospirota bacterium]|nr:hypothetical protein [Nitrospirota bacterium]
MITFLSSPKPFSGILYKNQLNAIQSWINVHPNAEVILYGDSPGCKEVCAILGIKHVDKIECSPSGVPYFGAIVDHAQKYALYDIQIYLNCDILLTQAILDAIKMVYFPRFLIVGQRIDLGEEANISFQKDNWHLYMATLIRNGYAKLHAPSGMDYFIFTRGLWDGMKPLVIGRAGYDSALVSFCLKHSIPIIDATYMIPALHQYHDYNHLKNKEKEVMSGVDAMNNQRMHEVVHSAPNIIDATWQIYNGQLIRNISRGDYLRHFESFLRYKKNLIFLSYVIRAIWRVLTGVRVYKPHQIELSEVIEHMVRK